MKRLIVHFSGHVQGVGFRFTVKQIASAFAVNGFVRNLDDGRVELVTEGNDDEVNRFVQAIEQRMNGYVEQSLRTPANATGEFRQFDIRR
jgi:acylphosphatase